MLVYAQISSKKNLNPQGHWWLGIPSQSCFCNKLVYIRSQNRVLAVTSGN